MVPDIDCADSPRLGVSIVPNFVPLLVGFALHQINVGYMLATIALMAFSNFPYLISISNHLDHHIRMHKYDSNCTEQMNWFDLAGIPCLVYEPELLNAPDIIEAIPAATF